MSEVPEASPEAAGYIRGGGGVAVSGRKVMRLLSYLVGLALAVSAGLIARSTSDQNHRANSLSHGAPIQATVTGCIGVSSGIGMAIEYWQCQVAYTYAGKRYDEVLGGSRTRLAVGQILPAVVARSSPTVVSTVAGAPQPGSYASSVALGLAAILLWVVLLFSRARRAGPAVGTDPPQPEA